MTFSPDDTYKWLGENAEPCNGGYLGAPWPLPSAREPGKWVTVKGEIRPCLNGLHYCSGIQILTWIGSTLWLIEADKKQKRLHQTTKSVCRRARLVRKCERINKRTLGLFACDCAQRVLDRVKKPDSRSVRAIKVTRAFLNGQASIDEMITAEVDAMIAANEFAIKGLYRYGDDDSYTASNAADAANTAARGAIGVTAFKAASNPGHHASSHTEAMRVWEKEREWQLRRLFDYVNGEAG